MLTNLCKKGEEVIDQSERADILSISPTYINNN